MKQKEFILVKKWSIYGNTYYIRRVGEGRVSPEYRTLVKAFIMYIRIRRKYKRYLDGYHLDHEIKYKI